MAKKQLDADVEYISYKLEGEEAELFRAYKKKQNLKNNAEAARKALFDQIQKSEAA